MEEKLSYKEFLDRNDSWTMDDGDHGFDTQQAFKPMEVTGKNLQRTPIPPLPRTQAFDPGVLWRLLLYPMALFCHNPSSE